MPNKFLNTEKNCESTVSPKITERDISTYQVDIETKYSIWSLRYFSLFLCLVISVFLVIFYFYSIKPYVFLPADILMWAETNFVGDIIKLRTGAPIYTPPEDNNSTIYTPAAQLLTYAISWIIGKETSIVTWRVIQLCYVSCAALIATICSNIIRKLAYPDQRFPFPKTWFAFTFFIMFLAATSPQTNRFVHCLHADALSLLVSMLCFLTMLLYLKSPNWKYIILMTVCTGLGYFTKQFLINWSAVMLVFLLLHNYRDIKRLALFITTAAIFVAITIGICYLLWGNAFIFWTFEVMGGDRKKIVFSTQGFHISLLRSLDHTVQAWMEIIIGVIGGILILLKRNFQKLGPLWVGWIALISTEALSSGAGWGVLYHFGPGIVIGTIWMLSALPGLWPTPKTSTNSEFPLLNYWAHCALMVAVLLTIFTALHVVPTLDKNEARYWGRRPPPDVYRYISDIEREFEGLPADKVLLDIGNWIYLRHSVLAKDRAVSLADQPCGGVYKNFDVMVSRIRNKTYEKILVRDFHSPFFLYDWTGWEKPSGVRKALLECYTEVRIIPAVEGDTQMLQQVRHTGPVSVLIPKPDTNETPWE